MTKKLMFILLMSGVILSPLGVYAMNEEGAPRTPVSKAVPPYIESLEKKVAKGQTEHWKEYPGGNQLPPAAFLSPEEADQYYDYKMLQEKVRQGQNKEIEKHQAILPPAAFLSPEEANRYYDYFNKK